MRRLRRAALALAILLLLAGLLWKGARRSPGEGSVGATRTSGENSTAQKPPPPKTNSSGKGPEAEVPAPAAEKPAEVIEGFVIVTDVGLAVGEAVLPDAQETSSLTKGHIKRNAVEVLLAHIIEPPALENLPRAAAVDFDDFLAGASGPGSVPQAHLRLRVRPAEPTKEFPTPRLRVEEILETEILGDDWLVAWRDMLGLERDLAATRALEPGLEKRNRILEIATGFSEALARARAARAGDPVVRWRVRREAAVCGKVLHFLGKFGLGAVLPETPEPGRLWDLAKEAGSPDELRQSVLRLWGPEALFFEIAYIVPQIAEDDGAMIGWDDRSVALEKACAMSREQFSALQKDLRAWDQFDEDHPATSKFPDSHRRALGFTTEPATRGDCERLILEGAVRIVSVEPGSIADAAGLRAGDIVYRFHRFANDESGAEIESSLVESPEKLEMDLESPPAMRFSLDYLRDGRSQTATMTLPR